MTNLRAESSAGGPIRPVVAVTAGGRRRRPSGEAPPLPRDVPTSTRVYVAVVVAVVALELGLAVGPVRAWLTGVDLAVLRLVEQLRAEALVDAARALVEAVHVWPVRVLFWTTLLVLVAARRAHHLVAYLAIVLASSLVSVLLAVLQGRMRPAGVDIVGAWSSFSHPSIPLALLALLCVGAVRTLFPTGPLRRRATVTAAIAVGAVGAARVYLGVDHPSDVAAAVGLGWALPMAAFSLLLPDEAFAIRYGGATRAHVDLTGRRGKAIVQALDQQLGLRATALEPFGLAGSAGSMPMRVAATSAGGEQTHFAKLYTLTHLRSDRWYKIARMVLYGRLEDEKPFSTVRRLVEYEDHMLRLLRDAGLPVPEPRGLVEITPEREYVLVMEFFGGAREVGDVRLSDEQIDCGLRIVRQLWEAGVAHRDLKPSNVLVRDQQVLLIDVAFATVRPTPWRQAVDLANMMLTLALSSSAERVYARAIRQFAPEDVSEAFAASRSVTLPTQLRTRLAAEGGDLVGRFRALAPARAPVSIQLWSVRRVLVTVSVLAAAGTGLAMVTMYARVANLL